MTQQCLMSVLPGGGGQSTVASMGAPCRKCPFLLTRTPRELGVSAASGDSVSYAWRHAFLTLSLGTRAGLFTSAEVIIKKEVQIYWSTHSEQGKHKRG